MLPVNGSSLLQQGLQGMLKSSREMTRSAHDIARAGTQIQGPETATLDIAEPMINMKIEQHIFDASAKVVKSADHMIGTLLDIKA